MTQTPATDPEVFLAVEDLELVGRGLAESVWHGRHGARRSGSGTEFDRHRGYLAGDDLRRVNWALLARHKKLFTKESRLETMRPVYILLDITGSMATAHGPWSKHHYAQRVAAGLAWLAGTQGDAPALALLRNGLESVIPRSTGQRHFAGICATLANAKAEGEGDYGKIADEIPMFCRQPGFVVMISDFFDHEDALIRDLAGLKVRGHDVLALQLLDPFEAVLPEKGDYSFIDLESGELLRTSVESLRVSHAAAVAAWREKLRTNALASGIRWATATTADPLVPTLRTWLDSRGG